MASAMERRKTMSRHQQQGTAIVPGSRRVSLTLYYSATAKCGPIFTERCKEDPADCLPPRVQRLRLKLMRNQYSTTYVPGRLLATAAMLLRAPLPYSETLQIDSVKKYTAFFVDRVQESLPMNCESIREHQATDKICSALARFCDHGWPAKSKLPGHLTP